MLTFKMLTNHETEQRTFWKDFVAAIVAAIIIGFLLTSTGCSTIQSVLSPNPNVVSSLEASLAAADNAALGYAQFCVASPKSSLCNLSILQNMQTARGAAYTAVTLAEANETADTVTAAQNAISAYQAVVNATSSTSK